MRVVPLAFVLVAFGHLAYVAGELDPIALAAVFDSLTVLLMLGAAWSFSRAGATVSGALAAGFVALAVVKVVDFLTSFLDGVFLYHIGFVGVVAGAVLVAIGAVRAWRLPGYRAGAVARTLRWGAALGAAGSFEYFLLAAMDGLAGDDMNVGFLVGALAATIGWGMLACRPWTDAPRVVEARPAPAS